jgi:hypothetical protein
MFLINPWSQDPHHDDIMDELEIGSNKEASLRAHDKHRDGTNKAKTKALHRHRDNKKTLCGVFKLDEDRLA